MKPILLNDCSPEVTQLLSSLLGEKTRLLNERAEADKKLDEYRMVVLETGADSVCSSGTGHPEPLGRPC